MENRLKTLGLCARAKKLVYGEELVLENVRNGKCHLIFIASDIGAVANKNVHDKAAFYNVDIIDSFCSEELSIALGVENRKVIGVLDEGFAKILKK